VAKCPLELALFIHRGLLKVLHLPP